MRKISGLQELHVAQGGWTMLERGGSGLGATSRCWRGSMGLVTASGLDLGTPGIQARISSWKVTGWHFFFFSQLLPLGGRRSMSKTLGPKYDPWQVNMPTPCV